jgi:hypothetical protein
MIGRRSTDKWQGECYISRIRQFPKFGPVVPTVSSELSIVVGYQRRFWGIAEGVLVE